MGHRVAKILAHGYSGDGSRQDIDHLCRNRACCNPSHLEWVTKAENTKRQLRDLDVKRLRKCPSGEHVMWGANIAVGADGTRSCRGCSHE